MDMAEQKLKILLDFHRFEKNPRLERLLAETDRRCGLSAKKYALDEDSLEGINAAGDIVSRRIKEDEHEQ